MRSALQDRAVPAYADRIIVLEEGKVVQRGTHEELWQQGGVYEKLIRSEG